MHRFHKDQTLKSYASIVTAFDESPQSLWSFIKTAVTNVYIDSGADPEEIPFDSDLISHMLGKIKLRGTKATSFLGQWHGGDHVIKVSDALTDEGWKDTLLHEIAHAMLQYMLRCDDHGPNWKAAARELGASPKATGSDEGFLKHVKSKMKPVAECKKCGYILHRQRRRDFDGYTHKYDTDGNKCGGSLRNTDGWMPEWARKSDRELQDAALLKALMES